MGHADHTEHHPAPKRRWNKHAPDFFPDKATPTSQLTSLLLSAKTCEEIYNLCSQTLPFSLQAMPDQPKETKPFTLRCDASPCLLCWGWDEPAARVGMLQAVCPRVAGQAFNRWPVPAPGRGQPMAPPGSAAEPGGVTGNWPPTLPLASARTPALKKLLVVAG